VIGMLGQDERKRFYLEDFTSRIVVDLTHAVYTDGLFTINCVVLVEGEVIDDILHVQVRTGILGAWAGERAAHL
jgi:hypothetical protein